MFYDSLKLKKEGKIFYKNDDIYYTRKGIRKIGLSFLEMEQVQQFIINNMEKNVFYTMAQLVNFKWFKDSSIVNNFFELGINIRTIECLIASSNSVRSINTNPSFYIICDKEVTLRNVIEGFVYEYDSLIVDDITTLFNSKYKYNLEKYRLIKNIRISSMYYNLKEDRVYYNVQIYKKILIDNIKYSLELYLFKR